MTKKISKNYISSIQRILMLLFFTAAFVNGAKAQNSCSVTGPNLTQEVIVTCAVPSNGPLLTYQANPSLASTYSWSISNVAPFLNTSGAFIVGSTTSQTVTVNPGNVSGSFFLVATVTQIAPPNSVNSCAVSVAVYKPEVVPVTGSRCGPGTVTIGTTGCTLSSALVTSTVRWYDAPVGGNLVHTGTTFNTPSISTTTSYWAECNILITPQLPSQPFNCTSPRTEVVATVFPLPVVGCPPNQTLCIASPAFTLTGGTPAGGTYSGPGVSAGQFNPAAAGVGTHTITYTYTDGNNCTNSCTFTITVQTVPTVTCPPNQSVCINAPAFTLTGGAPVGGTYSGTGVSGGQFNPAAAGIGTHTITYSYTIPGTNCNGSCTFTITVNPLPVVTCRPNMFICLPASAITLTGSTPAGGTYSGPGVSGGQFDPAVAGVGTHTITYTYTDGNNCTSSCIFQITVSSVSATMNAPTTPPNCGTAGNTVSGTVSGGNLPYTCSASFDAAGSAAGWSVTGCSITGSTITVTYTAGTAATTTLTVIVTDANGCQATATVVLTCQEASQGCSPGFWKNHTQLWDQASDFVVSGMPGVMGNLKFTTSTSFISYFGLSAAWASAYGFPANITMLGAISQQGGQCKALARHAVSALLASGGGLTIPYPAGTSDFTSLYDAIKAALLSGNCGGTFGSQLANISAQDHVACSELKRLYGN